MQEQIYRCEVCKKERNVDVPNDVILKFVPCKNANCLSFNKGMTLIKNY